MARELNRFLTTLDASFLYFERPREPLHIGSCMIYEGRIEPDELKQVLADRLHLVPRYRQRAVFPPFSISHPLWIDDPDFDLDSHIDVLDMTKGGDRAEFSAKVAEAYAGMLPRNRPLWSATIVRGLPEGASAIVWKVHHAMVDGVSGVELTMALNDFGPEEKSTAAERDHWQPQPVPEPMNLLQEAVQHRLSEIATNVTTNTFDAFRPDRTYERMKKMADASVASFPTMLRSAPPTPFNRQVSGELGYAWTTLSFTELREVKSQLGGTVNDLVLAILSGGLGRYLRAQGEPTRGVELRAMCPVSMRSADQGGQLGNQVSSMIAPLFVGIEDPVVRLEAESKAMTSLKNAGQAEAFHEMSQLGSQMPPAWQSMAGLVPPGQQQLFNTVSTNVPGPQIPLYQAGRRLLAWLPMGVVSNNIGLFVAILTYNQAITLGLTVDAELIPDPWVLSEDLAASYEELREAAGVVPHDIETTTCPTIF